MNRIFPLVFISALILFGALYFFSDPEAPSKTSTVVVQETVQSSTELSALMDRVEHLESEVARLKTARRRPGPGSRAVRAALKGPRGPGAPNARSEGPSQTTDGLAENMARENSPVRREVTQIVRDEFANMRGEWREMRRARHEARDGERVEKFAESAELDEEQVGQMSDLLAQERERVGDLFRAARDTYDFRGAREKVRELKGETDRAIGDVLDEKQLEMWKEDRAQRQRRRPW